MPPASCKLPRSMLCGSSCRCTMGHRSPATFARTQLRAGQKVVTQVRVVVADDDLLLREGLASLLDRTGFEVVGQAGDGVQLLAMVRDTKPELVVADIRMPPTHTTEGLDAGRVIREEFPDVGIMVLSAHVDVEHAMELLASGRSIGYLLKNRITELVDFVDTAELIANR